MIKISLFSFLIEICSGRIHLSVHITHLLYFHHGALITMLKAICLGINRRGVSNSKDPAAKLLLPELPRALLSTATQLLLLHHHQCCYTTQHRLGALPPSATAPPSHPTVRQSLRSLLLPQLLPWPIAATARGLLTAPLFATANAKTNATAWTNPSNGCCYCQSATTPQPLLMLIATQS